MSNRTQTMTDTAQRIFETADSIIEAMNVGERKQIKELAVDVGTALGMETKKVLGFVNHYAHESDIAYVTRGKKGGIVKGTRPAKVVKVKRVKKVDAAPVLDTAVSN